MNRNIIVAISLVVFTTLLFIPWLNRPFTGHHDFVGAFNSQMARNYLRYGFVTTKLGQVTNFGQAKPEEFTYHTHHPPGVPLMLALVYAIFGEQEWVARGLMAGFSLGSVWLYILIISQAAPLAITATAGLLMVISPLFIYPSILPVYEAPALFLLLLQLYSFSRFAKTKRPKYWLIFIAAVIAGNVAAWVTYFGLPILTANELRQRKPEFLKKLLLLQIVSVGFFFLHLAHTKYLTGDWFGGGLGEVFLKRVTSQGETDSRYVYSNTKYIVKVADRLKNYYGLPLLAISIIGLLRLWTSMNQKLVNAAILLATIALILPVIFRNYVFVHDYTLFYTSPLIGFMAALGIDQLVNWTGKVTGGLNSAGRNIYAIAAVSLILITILATRSMWQDLKESISWDETSFIIGRKLRQTTLPNQNIFVVNPGLKEEEVNLGYYADRKITYPDSSVQSVGNMGDPDAIVIIVSDRQFKPEAKQELLKSYRIETDQGVEYYYRK